VVCPAGSSNNIEGQTMKITQSVLVQSLMDEFEPPREYTIPAPGAGEVLKPDDSGDELLDPGGQTKYRNEVGKLLHLTK
jgi:hypothetical protein